MGCLCLADLEDEEISSDDDEDAGYNSQANGSKRGKRKVYAYHSHGVKKGLLRSKMLNSKEPLYECHVGCSCSNDCPNRVVERGRTIPLQIFRTPDRGWGK
jgi:histone-lysine N-methyltransferase SUV39H